MNSYHIPNANVLKWWHTQCERSKAITCCSICLSETYLASQCPRKLELQLNLPHNMTAGSLLSQSVYCTTTVRGTDVPTYDPCKFTHNCSWCYARVNIIAPNATQVMEASRSREKGDTKLETTDKGHHYWQAILGLLTYSFLFSDQMLWFITATSLVGCYLSSSIYQYSCYTLLLLSRYIQVHMGPTKACFRADRTKH